MKLNVILHNSIKYLFNFDTFKVANVSIYKCSNRLIFNMAERFFVFYLFH